MAGFTYSHGVIVVEIEDVDIAITGMTTVAADTGGRI